MCFDGRELCSTSFRGKPSLLVHPYLHLGSDARCALCRELRFGSFTSLQQQPEMQAELAVAASSPSRSARRRHRRKSSAAVEQPSHEGKGDTVPQESAAEHQQQQRPGPHGQPAAGTLQQGVVEGNAVPQAPAAEPLVLQKPGPHELPVAGQLQRGAGEGDPAIQAPAAEHQQQQRPSPQGQPATGDQVAGAPGGAGGHVEVRILEQQERRSAAAEEQGQGQWQPVRGSRVSPAHPRQRGGRAAEYKLAAADTGQSGGLQHAEPSSVCREPAGVAGPSEHQRVVPRRHHAGIEPAAGGHLSHAAVPGQQPRTDRQAAPADGQPTPPATPVDQQADAVQQLAAERAEGQLLRQQLAAAEAALRREVATATELREALQVGWLSAASSMSCCQAYCRNSVPCTGQDNMRWRPCQLLRLHFFCD